MSGPIRLPVRALRGDRNRYAQIVDRKNELVSTVMAGFAAAEQIAAALNATAPGQAAEGQPKRDQADDDERAGIRLLFGAAPEPAGEQRRCEGDGCIYQADHVGPCVSDYPAPDPLRSQLESHLATPPEERPELVVDVAAAWPQEDDLRRQQLAAEVAREIEHHERRLTEDQCFGVERRRQALAEALVDWFCSRQAPADPGEELRLLRLLERRCRTAHSPDIDCAEDLLEHMRNAIDPVLDQLDALRAAREGRP